MVILISQGESVQKTTNCYQAEITGTYKKNYDLDFFSFSH